MVPIAANHAAHVVDGDVLPGFVADVLPARDFLEHEQPDFVAGIKKMPRLRVVGRPDNIAFEVVREVPGRRDAAHGRAWPVRRMETSDGDRGRAT